MADQDDAQHSEKPAQSPAPKRARKPKDGTPASDKRARAQVSSPTARLKQAVEPVTDALSGAGHAIADGGAAVTGATRDAAKTTQRASVKARRAIATVPAAGRRAAATGARRTGKAIRSRTAATLGAAAVGLMAGVALNLGRKAAVQAPSALAGDWFDAVKAEHKMALTLFDALQKTSDSDTGKRTTLLTQLKHALGKHAFMEENVLYPALRVNGDRADADKLNHDHGYVKQYLYDLENLDNDPPAYSAKVAEFRAEIEKHIHEEEQAIFPPLHAAMGADGNAKLTAQANKEAFKLA